jgi:hypothetical protein
MKRLSSATLLLLGVLNTGCGGSTAPQAGVDGNWQGSTGGQTVSISLASSGLAVSGSGTITPAGLPSYDVTISGTFVVPTLAVTMTSAQHPSIGLTSTVGNGTMSGALNGAEFVDAVIVLNRK